MKFLRKIWNATRADGAPIAPERALLHPFWLGALMLLVLNDHVLKHSALAGPMTGKLSDFAGLVVAPVVLAALLRVGTRRGLIACAAVTGAVFALINVSPGAAAMFDAMASTIFGFHTTVDPTDLIALVAIPVGLFALYPSMETRRAVSTRRLAEYAALTVGATACVATSPPPCEGADCTNVPPIEAQVSILNKSNEMHVLRMRRLRDEVSIDCERVAADPNEFLKDGAFGPAEQWFVQSGQEIGVQPGTLNQWGEVIESADRPCHGVLVESDTTPDVLIFWDAEELDTKTFQFDADVPKEIPADPQTVVLQADYSGVADRSQLHEWRFRTECGGRADLCNEELLDEAAAIPEGARYSWKTQYDDRLHWVRPTIDPGITDPPEECRVPTAGEGVEWEDPPLGEWQVEAIEFGIDGCHRLELGREGAEETTSWWLCVPERSIEVLLPSGDDYARIGISRQNQPVGSLSEGSYEALRMDVTRRTESGPTGERYTIYITRGAGMPSDVEMEVELRVREGCAPVEENCGQVSLPADLWVEDAGMLVTPGESLEVGTVIEREVHLVRSVVHPVADATCENGADAGAMTGEAAASSDHFETVIIKTN